MRSNPADQHVRRLVIVDGDGNQWRWALEDDRIQWLDRDYLQESQKSEKDKVPEKEKKSRPDRMIVLEGICYLLAANLQ